MWTNISYLHVDFTFVEVANVQMELGYATFPYPAEPSYTRSTEHDEGRRGTRMGCVISADQNLASEREQNAKCAARGFHCKFET
jgi:hypothetical protein